jgi:hypothetical protein
MSLTPAQLATLKAAIIADPTAGPMRTAGDSYSLLEWCNGPSSTLAWSTAATASDIFDSLTISTYDSLSAGKRDALRMVMDRGLVDASKGAIRAGFADIFAVTGGYTDSAQLAKMVNGALTVFATNAQKAIGGTTPAALGGVSALKRTWAQLVTQAEANLLVN